jgi:5-aminolevulinate synthase
MHEALDTCGAGAGGTRNISGTNHYHVLLERELADLHGKEAALLFTSGYVSNWASLSTLGANIPGCVIISDEKNHASMIEGIRHSKAEKRIFKHNDPADLDRILSEYGPDRPKIVAFESVYSMDGDIAPMRQIVRRRREARRHDLSRRGPRGRPLRPARRRHRRARGPDGPHHRDRGHARQGLRRGRRLHHRLGRPHRLRALLCLGFIFTTALPPHVAAGALASIRHLKASQMERMRQRDRVAKVRARLDAIGIPYCPIPATSCR